jgi:hypothetical protein
MDVNFWQLMGLLFNLPLKRRPLKKNSFILLPSAKALFFPGYGHNKNLKFHVFPKKYLTTRSQQLATIVTTLQ